MLCIIADEVSFVLLLSHFPVSGLKKDCLCVACYAQLFGMAMASTWFKWKKGGEYFLIYFSTEVNFYLFFDKNWN